MREKVILAIIFCILLISFVSAITGSLGNARAVLHADVGEKIERFVIVKNVNDVPINIEIFASGDLENYTKIIDNNFILEPKEEKNAYFTIDVRKNGTTETKINVKYTPEGERSGVGLSSSVIIIAKGENTGNEDEGNSNYDETNEDEGNSNYDETNEDEENSGITGAIIGKKKISAGLIAALISTLIILAIFVVLLVILFKKSGKNKRKKR